MMKHDREIILNNKISLNILPDLKQVFDFITKASHTTEKCLMIDISATRQAYERGEISNVGLVLSDNNLGGVTELIMCKALKSLLLSGVDKMQVKQWIIRIKAPSKLI